jgi:hypothetical protein
MLGDQHDDFYDARLVADARLHLSTIMNGQYSEPFFVTMCKIMKRETYLGYKTFRGKDVKLKGIIDFFYSKHYGLGINQHSINLFLANCSQVAIEDKTQTQYAYRLITWLRGQDPRFDFPAEFFEYKRLCTVLRYMPKRLKKERWRQQKLLLMLYKSYPHLLKEIGSGRQFKNIVECCEHYKLCSQFETVRLIKFYKNPNAHAVKALAEDIHERLDKHKRRVLIATLIELYKRDDKENDAAPANES